MRIALGIEYDGSHYHGWQTQQPGVVTVQETLEAALSRVANHPVQVSCAGRTDSGVHAFGQVVHFDTEAQRGAHNWLLGVNTNLPFDINVSWVKPVADDFHARFSATGRRYRYLILNRLTRSALLHGRATWVHRPLDHEAMHRAGQVLLGAHDFSSYRAIGCQAKHPVRTLEQLTVTRRGDLVELAVSANAFLHHMVRNIAGVLLAVGRGDQPEDYPRRVLEAKDRTQGGVTAPPDGLYFAGVRYPDEYGIPEPPPPGFLP
jgi:tRNA pseudouridine38-40 synthase